MLENLNIGLHTYLPLANKQWGHISSISEVATKSVSYPIAMSSITYAVYLTPNEATTSLSTETSLSAASYTTKGFTLYTGYLSPNTSYNAKYFAIGS